MHQHMISHPTERIQRGESFLNPFEPTKKIEAAMIRIPQRCRRSGQSHGADLPDAKSVLPEEAEHCSGGMEPRPDRMVIPDMNRFPVSSSSLKCTPKISPQQAGRGFSQAESGHHHKDCLTLRLKYPVECRGKGREIVQAVHAVEIREDQIEAVGSGEGKRCVLRTPQILDPHSGNIHVGDSGRANLFPGHINHSFGDVGRDDLPDPTGHPGGILSCSAVQFQHLPFRTQQRLKVVMDDLPLPSPERCAGEVRIVRAGCAVERCGGESCRSRLSLHIMHTFPGRNRRTNRVSHLRRYIGEYG